jgi:hypothetical protein
MLFDLRIIVEVTGLTIDTSKGERMANELVKI